MKQLTIAITAIAAVLLITTPSFAADNNTLSDGQVQQVKTVVHDYLVTNPQVLVEASQALQQQETKKMQDQAQKAIVTNADGLFGDPNSPMAGNAKGNITIIEFFDYQCPHCKDMKPKIEEIISTNKDVRIVYKELPIFGQSSRDAAAAALAANKQGAEQYLKLHNALLIAPNPLDQEKIMKIAKDIAKDVGLDTNRLATDMKDATIQKQIDDNLQLAQALNLVGTPTFVISKWQVGSKANNVSKAAFVPGVPTRTELQTLVDNAKKQ